MQPKRLIKLYDFLGRIGINIGGILATISKTRKFMIYGVYNRFSRIVIETTDKCNRKCKYCPIFNDGKKKDTFMTRGMFYSIIDELVEIGFRGIIELSNYGEPLLDKRLEEFTRYIRDRLGNKAYVYFSSNGDFLTRKRFESLIDSGIEMIRITQHGRKQIESNEFLRGLTEEDKKYIFVKILNEDSDLFNRGGLVKVKMTYRTANIADIH